jgi:hypothetical protein
MNQNDYSDLFKRKENHFVVRNLPFPIPNWETVIKNIDINVSKNLNVRSFDNFGLVTHETNDIEESKNIRQLIQKNNPDYLVSGHLYISLSKVSKSFGKHNDTAYVWFWQCIGSTEWKVYETEKLIFKYKLNPGDLIYIPKEMYHDVTPLTPRAGISFGIEKIC